MRLTTHETPHGCGRLISAAMPLKWMKDPFNFTREDTDEFYDRMIQTAAIATAAAESVVRQRDMNGKTFYEPL